ncbi:unnamed protein product [Cylindrotheca closterium]|uniref:Uncharacterized protein n=1 Tax=Cylindrotheca closterium TaxID=2856 RepID=A0AAD2CH80_9STRA|nr:unnamed protein product [Cylindrotheca closterium]
MMLDLTVLLFVLKYADLRMFSCEFNLHGQFDDIDDSKREELLADADNDVDDLPELTIRFQGDDDYESDDDLGDEGDEEEEPIVADLDHHQENVNSGTNDIGSLVTDLEDLQEPPEEEIVFEPEEPQVAKVTRSGQTFAFPKLQRDQENGLRAGVAVLPIKAKFDTDEGLNFIQQYYINQGLKKFGDDGKDAVDKELRPMLLRDCFTPEFVKDMTASEQKKAQSAMMLLTEKQFKKTIKGCLVYRGD